MVADTLAGFTNRDGDIAVVEVVALAVDDVVTAVVVVVAEEVGGGGDVPSSEVGGPNVEDCAGGATPPPDVVELAGEGDGTASSWALSVFNASATSGGMVHSDFFETECT